PISKELVYKVLLVFELFAEFVEHLAALCLLRIAGEDKTEADLVDDGPIINQAAPKLEQDLVLSVIFVRRDENALDPIVDQALQGAFELAVRIRVFELKQVEVFSALVEVESVQPILVATKSHMVDSSLAKEAVFLLEVEESEVILANPAAYGAEVGKSLIDASVVNHREPSLQGRSP